MSSEHPNTENRKHKDSLFVDYFSKDRDWKHHFLSLYNALHGTNLQVETTRLKRVNLEQVLYMNYYNDIAVMVNDQFIMMIEHQSTINPNMPLRLLESSTHSFVHWAILWGRGRLTGRNIHNYNIIMDIVFEWDADKAISNLKKNIKYHLRRHKVFFKIPMRYSLQIQTTLLKKIDSFF